MNRRVIVIGGGVIGAACAHFLNKSDWQVTILERKKFGCGAAHANCGLISPSHILPLPGPGVIGNTLRAMFRSNSPFSIKPRWDLSLWTWLVQFARHCNHKDLIAGGEALQLLLNSSRSLYEQLFTNEPLEAEFQREGVLFPFLSQSGMNHFAQHDRLLREHFDAGSERYDGDDVTKLEPALKPGLAGGWYFSGDAHLRPDRLMESWKTLLESRGVEIREDHAVKGFRNERSSSSPAKGKLVGRVDTIKGSFEAEMFVVCTGAWTPYLNRELGCRIPIQPGKGYSLTMSRPNRCPTIPMIFEEHRVAVTPWPSGYRLGSIMEFAGYDETLNPARIQLLRDGASHYLHEPVGATVTEEWFGWRPMTPDSLPIIDRSPNFPNVFLAAGHNMLGLTLAPVTGKLISEMVNGLRTHVSTDALSLKRF